MASLFYQGIKGSSHTKIENENSMARIYLDTLSMGKDIQNPECFIFGCSLNSEHNRLVNDSDHEYIFYDVGLIMFSYSFGLFYLLVFCIGLLAFYKRSRSGMQLKAVIFTIGVAQLTTLSHMPIGWGSGVVAFLLFGLFHIKYRSIRSYQMSRLLLTPI